MEKTENLKGKNRKIPLQKTLNFKGKRAKSPLKIFLKIFPSECMKVFWPHKESFKAEYLEVIWPCFGLLKPTLKLVCHFLQFKKIHPPEPGWKALIQKSLLVVTSTWAVQSKISLWFNNGLKSGLRVTQKSKIGYPKEVDSGALSIAVL